MDSFPLLVIIWYVYVLLHEGSATILHLAMVKEEGTCIPIYLEY